MTGRCGSVNVRYDHLEQHRCTRPAGHHGDCTDGTLHWTRLAEHLRLRGQVIEGTHVRKVQP